MSIILKYKWWKKINWRNLVIEALSKLPNHKRFKHALSNSELINPIVRFVTWALSIFEIIIGFLLFIPKWGIKGLNVSAGIINNITCLLF